jgi:hypothetical protein
LVVAVPVIIEVGVADVTDAVVVQVGLIRVGHRRAVVAPVSELIAIDVIGVVAGIAETVTVAVALLGIWHQRAVIEATAGVGGRAGAAKEVAVGIDRAAVAASANHAGVAGVADAVIVEVALSGVVHRRAHVADIADAVVIGVSLVGVGRRRAVIEVALQAVAVVVIAGVAAVVAVVVCLIGVWHRGTVVEGAAPVAGQRRCRRTDVADPVVVGVDIVARPRGDHAGITGVVDTVGVAVTAIAGRQAGVAEVGGPIAIAVDVPAEFDDHFKAPCAAAAHRLDNHDDACAIERQERGRSPVDAHVDLSGATQTCRAVRNHGQHDDEGVADVNAAHRAGHDEPVAVEQGSTAAAEKRRRSERLVREVDAQVGDSHIHERRRQPGAGIDAIFETVSVDVIVAGVAAVVVITITLGVVGNDWAIIFVVNDAVVVIVVVTDVAAIVSLDVALVAVWDLGAVVAGIADAVAIEVCLRRVGDLGTVIAGVADAVAVEVALLRVSLPRADIAGVAGAVAIAVGLRSVGDDDAIIDGVGEAVVVGVEVAGVTQAVGVGVALSGVGDGGAVVARVADEVGVDVVLGGIGALRTHIAGVADAVVVAVGLIAVARVRAIVDEVGDIVAVDVFFVVGDAVVVFVLAGVADAVAVEVGLIVGGEARTVVGAGADARADRAAAAGQGPTCGGAGVTDAVAVIVWVADVAGFVAVGVEVGQASAAIAAHATGVRAIVVRLAGDDLRRDQATAIADVADAVFIEVVLVLVGRSRAVVADVADPIVIAVGLGAVEEPEAVVSHVDHVVAIGVIVAGIGQPVAVVIEGLEAQATIEADPASIDAVGITDARLPRRLHADARRRLTGVADSVAVDVGKHPGPIRAEVAGVTVSVAVAVVLKRIEGERAVVAGVEDAVVIVVVVTGITEPVAIAVLLVVAPVRTVVAKVASPIAVDVALVGVADERAVILRVIVAIAIVVVVAGVAGAVVVGVGLIGVWDATAGVERTSGPGDGRRALSVG